MTDERPPLTVLERDVLAFEAVGWTNRETHDHAARDLFGYRPTRYTQILNAALTHPDALTMHPTFVRRALRLRAEGRGLLPVEANPRHHNRIRRTTP